MENIIFIAPPAAGKGTQSKMLSEKYHIPHISTGDLLREASLEENERGKMILAQQNSGQLVSDNIILELLEERLVKPDCSDGYILDGFPRNLEQALSYEKILSKIGKKLGIVIFLDVDKELAYKRMSGRLSCPECGSIYNESVEDAKPKKHGICDKCGVRLKKRMDDTSETYANRYDSYTKRTAPLIEYYKKKNVLYQVKSITKKETFENIIKILERRKEV